MRGPMGARLLVPVRGHTPRPTDAARQRAPLAPHGNGPWHPRHPCDQVVPWHCWGGAPAFRIRQRSRHAGRDAEAARDGGQALGLPAAHPQTCIMPDSASPRRRQCGQHEARMASACVAARTSYYSVNACRLLSRSWCVPGPRVGITNACITIGIWQRDQSSDLPLPTTCGYTSCTYR